MVFMNSICFYTRHNCITLFSPFSAAGILNIAMLVELNGINIIFRNYQLPVMLSNNLVYIVVIVMTLSRPACIKHF